MISPEQYVAEARKLVSARVVRYGRDNDALDCAGLLIRALRNAGWSPPPGAKERFDYPMGPDPRILETMRRYCRPAPALVPACVLLFQFAGAAGPQHFAIYCGRHPSGGETMIHADMMRKQIVEHGFRGHWPKRLHSRWLLPGINYSAHLTSETACAGASS